MPACSDSRSFNEYQRFKNEVQAHVVAGTSEGEITQFLNVNGIEYSKRTLDELRSEKTPTSDPALTHDAITRIKFLIQERPGAVLRGGAQCLLDIGSDGEVIRVIEILANIRP